MPPWAIGASRPAGMASTKSAPAPPPARPTARRRWPPGCRTAGSTPRSGEEVGPLRHEADAAPERLRVEIAHVDAVDQHVTAGDVVEPRHHRQQRGLPAPVLPMTADVLPGRAGEGDVAQHRCVGTGVAERGPVELQPPVAAARGTGPPGERPRPGLEDLPDPVGADRGPREHHRHEGGHHDRHEDLHQVGEERGERADLHLAGVDAPAPNQSTATLDTFRPASPSGRSAPAAGPARSAVREVGVGAREALVSTGSRTNARPPGCR